MRLVCLAVLVVAAAGQLTVVERAPDLLEMCMGRNCTHVAFLPSILRTSYRLRRQGCAATIAVAYECGGAELCYVTRTVSDHATCVDTGGPMAV